MVVLCAPVARGATSVSRIPCLVPLVACGHPPRGFFGSLGEMGQKFLLTFRSFLLHWGCVVLLPFDSCPPGVAALNRRAFFWMNSRIDIRTEHGFTTFLAAYAPQLPQARLTTRATALENAFAYVRCWMYDLGSECTLRGGGQSWGEKCVLELCAGANANARICP